ncbi:hypothetical protein [Paracoccus sp. ME4]|uniref:hypothetical protein n=1 Tax=Paracoccus sp. ME4 TaxID=3138066 RepID=UPI00398B9A58
MSNALKALSASMNKNRPKVLRGSSNMVVEVLGYGDKTISAKVLNGPIIGQTIELDPGNKKVADFSTPSKAQTSSYTPVGGILRAENVSLQKDGTYKSNWTNAWIKTPGEDNQILVDQSVSYHNTGRTNKSEKPIVQLRTMDEKSAVKVGSLEQLEAALASAFENTRSALVIDTSEGYATAPYYLPGKRDGDDYVFEDPKAFAAKLIADMDADAKEIFAEILSTSGLTVVPVRNITVGPTTAEETQKAIDKAAESGARARIMSVNPFAYDAPTLGARLSGALARKDRDGKLEIPAEYADRLKEGFLATAPESAKAAFHADGWRGVSDTDLRDFFKSRGVEMKVHPSDTWNVASIHLQKFDGGDNFFAAKTFEQNRYGNPYPRLECCSELRAAYATELTEAVIAVVGAPSLVAKAEEKAPALDDDKPVDQQIAAEAQEVSGETADIDELLNQFGDEPIA